MILAGKTRELKELQYNIIGFVCFLDLSSSSYYEIEHQLTIVAIS